MECLCDAGCYGEGEMAEFSRKESRKARKEHICDECMGKISPGEEYVIITGRWEGEFDSYKFCRGCDNIRSSCGCKPVLGSLWDDIVIPYHEENHFGKGDGVSEMDVLKWMCRDLWEYREKTGLYF